ncbi:MAG: hypothetical protein KDB53_02850, partial [Planctomycetes bacterium]|nr:hypothetical protein [Planctomycetota bacterium]
MNSRQQTLFSRHLGGDSLGRPSTVSIVAAVVFLLFTGQVVAQTTYVVDGSLGASTPTTGPFQTIQEAIAEAVSGDTINILPGLYVESVTIAENLTITGPFAGMTAVGRATPLDTTNNAVIQNGAADAFIFEPGGSGSTVDGLSFSALSGIASISHPDASTDPNTAATLSDVSVLNCHFATDASPGSKALEILGATRDLLVETCQFMAGGSSSGASAVFSFFDVGGNLRGHLGFRLLANRFEGVDSTFVLFSRSRHAPSVSHAPTIQGNTFIGANVALGFYRLFTLNQDALFRGFKIYDNDFVSNSFFAMRLEHLEDSEIAFNRFAENGLWFEGSDADRSPTRNLIHENEFTGFIAIEFSGAMTRPLDSNLFFENAFETTGPAVIVDNGTGGTVTTSGLNFSGNWWNSSTGPAPTGSGASITGPLAGLVDFSPWLDSGIDDEPGSVGWQGDFSVLHVDDASPQIDTEATLDLDLADIVGGGDGTGTGLNTGIDPADGTVGLPANSGGAHSGTAANVFYPVSYPFVDGVFQASGANGATPVTVSSTGIMATLPSLGGSLTFGVILNGVPPTQTTTSFGPNVPVVSMHASAAITFDIDAMEAAHAGHEATLFTCLLGAADYAAATTLHILVDGVIRSTKSIAGSERVAQLAIELAPADRFLTIISVYGQNTSFSFKQGRIGRPTVRLVRSPNPSQSGRIEEAVRLVDPGGLVDVADGAYQESLFFVDGGRRVEGPLTGVAQLTGTEDTTWWITLVDPGSALRRLTLDGLGRSFQGSILTNLGTTSNPTVIEDCSFQDFDRDAIQALGAGSASILGCQMSGIRRTGIIAGGGTVLVDDFTYMGGAPGAAPVNGGITLQWQHPASGPRSIIRNSFITGASSAGAHGVAITRLGALGVPTEALIEDCVITGNRNGILVDDPANPSTEDPDCSVQIDTVDLSSSLDACILIGSDNARVRVDNCDLRGAGQAGLCINRSALVDAGDCLVGDITGLGSSTGGNDLSGYGFDDAPPWAIEI